MSNLISYTIYARGVCPVLAESSLLRRGKLMSYLFHLLALLLPCRNCMQVNSCLMGVPVIQHNSIGVHRARNFFSLSCILAEDYHSSCRVKPMIPVYRYDQVELKSMIPLHLDLFRFAGAAVT